MSENIDAAPVPASPESLGWLWVTAVNYLDQHGARPIAEGPPTEDGRPPEIVIDPYIKGARTVMFEDVALLEAAGFDSATTISITHNPEQVTNAFPEDQDDVYRRRQLDVHGPSSTDHSPQEPAKLLVVIARREEGSDLLRERLITIRSEAIQEGVTVLDPKIIERLLAPTTRQIDGEVEWEEVADNLGVAAAGEVFSQAEVDKLILLMQLSHEQETGQDS